MSMIRTLVLILAVVVAVSGSIYAVQATYLDKRSTEARTQDNWKTFTKKPDVTLGNGKRY
jgi:uncharacterized protein YxeA